MDWEEVEEYLKTCESAYTEIGSVGLFALAFTITPLRNRFNSGERTQELYDEIMETDL